MAYTRSTKVRSQFETIVVLIHLHSALRAEALIEGIRFITKLILNADESDLP